MHTISIVLKDFGERTVLSILSPDSGSSDDAGTLPPLVRPFNTCLADGFAGRYQSELGEAIQSLTILFGEMISRIVVFDLSASLNANVCEVD